jgi:hypothetical protein
MDPVTATIIAALAHVGEQAVGDAYQGLKKLIAARLGADSGVTKSVEDLEADPKSQGREIVLQEQVAKSGADKDSAILEAVAALQAAIQQQGAGAGVIQMTAGDNAIQFGQVSGGNISIDRKS